MLNPLSYYCDMLSYCLVIMSVGSSVMLKYGPMKGDSSIVLSVLLDSISDSHGYNPVFLMVYLPAGIASQDIHQPRKRYHI